MQDHQENTVSPISPEITAVHLPQEQDLIHEDEIDEEEDFEFSFVSDSPITADEIFSNGQIRPSFPVFNRQLLIPDSDGGDTAEEETPINLPLRRLLIDDRDAPSSPSCSSESEELDGVAAGSFCAWTPGSVPASPEKGPNHNPKSFSTGSSYRFRLRDLVIGRSHSDGKEKIMFLAPNPNPNPNPNPKAKVGGEEKKKGKGKGKEGGVTELDMVTAHRMFYAKNGSQGPAVKGGRQSFLPYRVGFFAGMNGISQSHHPF